MVERFSISRFTFTEDEALAEVWASGEDVRLREDSRFWEIEGAGHFQLSHHVLANELLADRLWQGVWAGDDIVRELGRMDESNEDNKFHVFCPADPRLVEQDSKFVLAACPTLRLPERLKSQLDSLATELLAAHVESGVHLSTVELRERLLRLRDDLDLGEGVELLESWLCGRSEWEAIARGLWLPAQLVPPPAAPKPFRVWRIASDNTGGAVAEECEYVEESEGVEQGGLGCVIRLPDPPVERHPDSSVSWTQVLRTIHLQGAYLPVPTAARFRYPRFVGRQGAVVVNALSHDSGLEGHIWLDRSSHRFFGDLLTEVLEWEEAGRKLYIRWQPAGLVLRLGEVDEQVREEETRHVDPQTLYELRMGHGESYRQSLADILHERGGLGFRALYDELSKRQGHYPSRPSVRAVLAHSPEFVRSDELWTWREAPGSARTFRRSIILRDVAAVSGSPLRDLGTLAAAVANAVREVIGKGG